MCIHESFTQIEILRPPKFFEAIPGKAPAFRSGVSKGPSNGTVARTRETIVGIEKSRKWMCVSGNHVETESRKEKKGSNSKIEWSLIV